MPPPLQPKTGLQPSILDRLVDPESAGTSIMTGYTVQQMYEAVLRDLEDLLNSLHVSHDIPAQFPETRNSIVLFGLPDLASIESISAEQRNNICKSIQKAVERFEPRLKSIRVTLIKNDEDIIRRSIKFRIDARLTVDPAPDVAFDTILEMGSGKYLVAPAQL